MISGIVETIESGTTPEVPMSAGLTFPARGSRERQVKTSAKIYEAPVSSIQVPDVLAGTQELPPRTRDAPSRTGR